MSKNSVKQRLECLKNWKKDLKYKPKPKPKPIYEEDYV
jgi:hypothetical protein